MRDYEPTPEQVEAFKRAWHEADSEGDTGNRVLRGLSAAGPLIAAEALREKAQRYREADENGFLFLPGSGSRVPWEAVADDLDRAARGHDE